MEKEKNKMLNQKSLCCYFYNTKNLVESLIDPNLERPFRDLRPVWPH